MRPLRTVHGLLAERAGLALLADPMMERATGEILAGDRPRAEVQRDIKQKERAREALVRRHRSAQLPEVRFQLFFAPISMRDFIFSALLCIKSNEGSLLFASRSMMGHMSSTPLCINEMLYFLSSSLHQDR